MSRIRTIATLAVLSLGLLGAGAGVSTATASATPTERTAQSAKWHLHFKDKFNGTELGSAWSHKNAGASDRDTCKFTSPNTDFSRNRNSSNGSVVKVHDGKLYLHARKKKCANGKVLWKSGALTTYGTMHMENALTWRITARIKFPKSSGNHAALWSLAVNPAAPTGPQELDMAESFGSEAKLCGGHTWLNYYWIYNDPAAQVKKCMRHSPTPWSGFHTYKVLWKGGKYARVYIDGVKRGELTGSQVPNTPEYLLLSNLVNDGKKVSPRGSRTMVVDSIKTEWR